MAKVTRSAPSDLPVKTKPVQGSVTAPAGSPVTQKPAATAPKGFQPAAPGLGKFASTAGVRATLFSRGPASTGVNRASNILGPNAITVGGLLERIGEHLEDPQNPTAHDLALMNGAFSILE